MLLWLMNLDFAGGGDAEEEESEEDIRQRILRIWYLKGRY